MTDFRTHKERRSDAIWIGCFMSAACFLLMGMPLGFSIRLILVALLFGGVCSALAYAGALTTQDDKTLQLRRNASALKNR